MADDSSRIDVELEFPVNLEAVLSVNFNVENFKMIFNFLLTTLREHAKSINGVRGVVTNQRNQYEDLCSQLSKQVATLREASDQHSSQLTSSASEISALSSQAAAFEAQISNNSAQLAAQQQDLNAHDNRLKEALGRVKTLEDGQSSAQQKIDHISEISKNHEARLKQLESEVDQALQAIRSMGGQIEASKRPEPTIVQVASAHDYSGDIRHLSSELASLTDRMAAYEHSRQETPSLDPLVRRLEALESDSNSKQGQINSNREDINQLKTLIKSLEKELSNKVNADDFDALSNRIASMGSPNSVAPAPGISSKDLNLLRDLSKKVEDLLRSYQAVEKLLARVGSLESAMPHKANLSDLESLSKVQTSSKSESDSSKLNALTRRVGLIEEALVRIPEGIDFGGLLKDILHIKIVIKESGESNDKKFNDILARLKELEAQLKLKASLDDLNAFEAKIQEKVIAICAAMGKKFADKAETKKALKYLEKLIKEYFEGGHKVEGADDAMFARKPLGGWSCASCEKALEKLGGKIGPYHPWNKMPHRDPADRIARAGPGFSRMLATFQPELLSQRLRNSGHPSHSPGSPRYYDEERPEVISLPPVTKHERPFTSYNG